MRRPFDASQVGPSLDRTGKPALSHCSLPEGSVRTRMRRSRFTEDRLLAQAGLQCLFSFRMEQAPSGSRPAHFQGTFQSEVGIRFAFAILVSGIRLTARASSFGADGVGCPTLRGGPWLSPQCRPFGSYQICSCSIPKIGSADAETSYTRFRYAFGFLTLTLAYWIDSLVRVARRVGRSHYDIIFQKTLRLICDFLERIRSIQTNDFHRKTSLCLSIRKRM